MFIVADLVALKVKEMMCAVKTLVDISDCLYNVSDYKLRRKTNVIEPSVT